MAALYQPLKWLATIVTPRWGFVLQLVLRRVEATRGRASILAKVLLDSIVRVRRANKRFPSGYQRKEGFTFIPSDVPPSPFRSVLLS